MQNKKQEGIKRRTKMTKEQQEEALKKIDEKLKNISIEDKCIKKNKPLEKYESKFWRCTMLINPNDTKNH